MSATYGSTSGFSKTTSKTFERAQALDNLGANIANVLKFARTETTTETVTTVFGAPEIGALDVLDATIVHSVDETVIDPSASSTVPPAARSYNPAPRPLPPCSALSLEPLLSLMALPSPPTATSFRRPLEILTKPAFAAQVLALREALLLAPLLPAAQSAPKSVSATPILSALRAQRLPLLPLKP
jgi:hypothetical protein